jgi:LIVCS family branched-chain amino acid:cation transporter
VLSPIKVTLLVAIVIKGFIEAPEASMVSTQTSEIAHWWHGLTQGYNTMDLLAAFFFAPIVISSLDGLKTPQHFVLKASLVGAFLLSAIYVGFGYLAYLYAPYLEGVSPEQLLGTIAIKVLGPYAGLIVSLTVTIACLTTAIALIAAFSNFVHKEIVREKMGHTPILCLSLLTTFAITTLNFQGIAHFLNPILEICYPGLILLTFYNLFMPLRKRESL